MFESAELGNTIEKDLFKKEEPKLRQALLAAQYEVLKAKKFPMILVVGGIDGAGKGETANILNEWMDPRYIRSHAFREPTDEERERPPMWRYWRTLPPKGQLGIYFHSWYSKPILNRVHREISEDEFDRRLEEIASFEKMLTDEGALILKLWFHLSKKRQKNRLKELEENKKTAWRVTDKDWKNFKIYEDFKKTTERALRETSRNDALWTVIEGVDPYYRSLTAGRTLLEAMLQKLGPIKNPIKKSVAPVSLVTKKRIRVVDTIDLSSQLEKKKYQKELEKYQGKINLLMRDPGFNQLSAVAVFEGMDAAGKGGAIRRITGALDARQYKVVPIAAPTEEERAQPYLWRFWRHLPRRNQIAIFDRSWYGRVLVERVEGYCSVNDWVRAYSEINDFEEQMAQNGVVVVKFWLQISKEEQLRRFKEREKTAFKKYKITEEDWRNRKKMAYYTTAMCDMVDHTSTEIAPWTLLPAEDKYFARIEALKTLCKRIEKAL
jgi:AMP-polyphosphate phosphotransferase